METLQLQRLIRLLRFWENRDFISDFLYPKNLFAQNYLTPFSDEIIINIISTGTKEGKKDLMKFYVHKLNSFQLWFNDAKNLFLEEHEMDLTPLKSREELEEFILETNEDRDTVLERLFSANTMWKYLDVLQVINEICAIYDIDLLNICDETGFPKNMFIDLSKPLAAVDISMFNYDQSKNEESILEEIKSILHPLKKAFKSEDHIDKIGTALVFSDNTTIDRLALLIPLQDFIKPFGNLITKKLIKRGRIGSVLPFYIKKNNENIEESYSEATILRMLSEYTTKIKLKTTL